MVEFVDNLRVYIEKAPQIHMRTVILSKMKEMEASESDITTINKLIKEQSLLVKGMYEVYKETKDAEELKDTIRRTCQKLNKPT